MRKTTCLATGVLLFGLSGSALAQDDGSTEPVQPVEPVEDTGSMGGDTSSASGGTKGVSNRFVERHLTLSPGTIRIDASNAGLGIIDSDGGLFRGGLSGHRGLGFGTNGNDFTAGIGIGASVGIIDNLEAGIMLLPIQFAPNGGFGDIDLYGRYAFLSGSFELAGQFALRIPSSTEFALGFGLPVLIHLGDAMRLDTGLDLELFFGPGDPFINIDVPVVLAFMLMDNLWLGARTGFFIANNFDGDGIAIPLGVHAGYTLASGGGILGPIDLTADFTWPLFITTTPIFDTVKADFFEILLGAAVHLNVF